MAFGSLQKVRIRFAAVLAACAFAALLVAFPAPALALFNEPADSYPATQELEGGGYSIGDVIYPADIPEGQILRVVARTTSRMCVMYENAVDCDNQTNKERALIMRQGNTIYVEFFMSKAYTYLYYPGTAEEAAALAPGDGTQPSPSYLAGDPASGYVPHRFSISIPALNSPVTMATFSGGNADRSQWYTRQVVFIPTADTLAAIEAAKAPAQYTVTFTDGIGNVLSTQSVAAGSAAAAPESPVREGFEFAGWDVSFEQVGSDLMVNALWNETAPGEDADGSGQSGESDSSEGGSGEPGAGDGQDSSGSSAASASGNVSRNADDGSGDDQSTPAANSGGMASAVVQGQTSSSSAGGESGAAGSEEAGSSVEADEGSSEDGADSSSSADEESGSQSSKETKRGIAMTMAGFDIPDGDGDPMDLVEIEEAAAGLTPLQVLSLVTSGICALGILWRAVGFRRGLG